MYEYLHFSYGSLTDTERNKGGLSKIQIATAVVTSFVSCFIVGAVISMSLMLWVRSVKRSKLRGRKIARLSKGHLSMKYSEVSLLSPGVVKAHLFEFPRSNLELQDIIGKFLSLCQCSYTMLTCFCSFGVFLLHLCLYIQVKDVLERFIKVKHMELCLMLQI